MQGVGSQPKEASPMFEVNLTESALADLNFFRKADRNIILDSVEQQLTSQPLMPTRNRKPLRTNDLSSWEMRVGEYRVFYDVDESTKMVTIKAVGRKEHNKLFIRGQEYQL
jgi:mRNA-degrading endonuclease RelE of RelBE toxin-antitoxin system